MKVGIVGLPTRASPPCSTRSPGGAETGDTTTTIDPNVAVVPVPDERLERRRDRRLVGGGARDDRVPRHRGPGARGVRGRGAGQPVPVRDPRDRRDLPRRPRTLTGGVPHPVGRIDPGDDIELIELELQAADLEQARRRLERDQAGPGARQSGGRRAGLARGRSGRPRGRPARPRCARSRGSPDAPRLPGRSPEADPLRGKRRRGLRRGAEVVAAHAQGAGATAVAISARIESELAEIQSSTRPPSCAASSASRSPGSPG